MTGCNLLILLGIMLGAVIYGLGEWVGYRQGRRVVGHEDAVYRADPGEANSDLADPYMNALEGKNAQPGDKSDERIPTLRED